MEPDAGSASVGEATPELVWLMLGLVLLCLAGASAARVVTAGQRAVVTRLGRARRVRGPGLVLNLPGLEQVRMVSLCPTSVTVPLDASTREGVRVRVRITVRYEIVDPGVAVETCPDPATPLLEELERTTRRELAAAVLPQLLVGRDLLAARIRAGCGREAARSGVRVLEVEVTTVEVELSRAVLRWVR